MDYTNITEMFLQESGHDLLSVIPDDGSNELNREERFIKKQFKVLQNYICKYNCYFDYNTLTEERKHQFDLILVDQLMFVVENGDLTNWNGFDLTTGADVNIEEKLIGPFVKGLLKSNGFLVAALC